MLDVVAFLLAGTVFGLGLGLLPGIHPNMIILTVPLLAGLNLGTEQLIALIVAIGVANTFA